jgi:hypothetical protein
MSKPSLFVDGLWQDVPKGTWVEIQNGKGDFTGARGTITLGPYGQEYRTPNVNFPPIYNILVTKPYRELATEVNFEAHKLRVLNSYEVDHEAVSRAELPLEQQTNNFTIENGKSIPILYPVL